MSNYLYGLDLSLKSTGIAIYDLDKKEFVHVSHHDTTLMKPEKGRDLNSLKLLSIYNKLYDLREEYPPKYIAVEAPYIAQGRGGGLKGASATEQVYMVHGVSRIVFADKPQEYYAPSSVKATIFHGHAKKYQIQAILIERFPYIKKMLCTYGVEGKKLTKKLIDMSEDESDAVSIALTYLINKDIIEWVKPEKEHVRVKTPDMDLKPKKTAVKRKKNVIKKATTGKSKTKPQAYRRGITPYDRINLVKKFIN